MLAAHPAATCHLYLSSSDGVFACGQMFLRACDRHSLEFAGQVNTGELRVIVTDPAGTAAQVAVTVSSEGTHYRNTLTTNSSRAIDCKELPFGMYSIQVNRHGFAPASITADIHSALPLERRIHLDVSSITTIVKVTSPNTIIDPYMPSAVMQIGSHDRSFNLRLNTTF